MKKLIIAAVGIAFACGAAFAADNTCIISGNPEAVATAGSSSCASASAALEGGVASADPSPNAPLEGGSVVSDESNVTDCDFTPGGSVFIVR